MPNYTDDSENPSSYVVVIGVSVGGLDALTEIFKPLPADFPATVLVAMHLAPQWESHMAEILDQRTALTVQQARSGDILCEGCVYIAPPNYHLVVSEAGVLWLSVADKVHFARPAADPLFTSAARVYGKWAIGVVLTGGDGDGAAGIQAIKRAGGSTIAQDAESSLNPEMPVHAAATGSVDRILPLSQIADALREMVGVSAKGRGG